MQDFKLLKRVVHRPIDLICAYKPTYQNSGQLLVMQNVVIVYLSYSKLKET
jgi:hypothetical protein